MSLHEIPVITVDGPSGTGKGTLCQYLAGWLGWHFLDSGALYRVLAHMAMEKGLSPEDESELAILAMDMQVTFKYKGGCEHILLVGYGDVSGAIRTEICGNAASRVAALSRIRAALLQKQRDFRQPPGLIADGRDMGTVVFPDAPLKIFLTASPEERAKRRYKQLKDKGIGVNLQRLSADISERDARDQGRNVSPLKPAPDAIVIDSSDLDAGEVCQQVSKLVQEKFPRDSGPPLNGK